MSVALVTDTTAYLPASLVREAGVGVVPLQVSFDEATYREDELSSAEVATLVERSRRVATSRPSPQVFVQAFEQAMAAGADEIVSVHLSSDLSGTCDAARLAAGAVKVPVHVVDSRCIGMGMGHAVLDGARAAARGGDGPAVADAVTRRAALASILFAVPSLEHLRRGGRISRVSATLGAAFSVRPLMRLAEGRIELVEKTRTAARASARLVERVAEEVAVAPGGVSVVVHHLADQTQAARLADAITRHLDAEVGRCDVDVLPMGAVAAAHLGPGALAVCISPQPQPQAHTETEPAPVWHPSPGSVA